VSKKTVLILLAVSVGGCCLFGTLLLALGAMASDPESTPRSTETASARSAPAGTDTQLGGYVIFGVSTPTAEGFTESLVGNWMLMDGASVHSIEAIHSDSVEVKTKRSAELWHFAFAGDGSYVFRYFISVNYQKVIWTEKGEWTSDGSTLTLNPTACTSKSSNEREDCLEPGARIYALSSLQLEELTASDNKRGTLFTGVRLTGPWPSFSKGSYRDLQRVQ
jgi:hypothetical protein